MSLKLVQKRPQIGKTLITAAKARPSSTTPTSSDESSAYLSEDSDNHPRHFSSPNIEAPQHRSDATAADSPFDWILDHKSQIFSETLKSVRDRELPQRLVNIVAALEARPGEADCVKQLLCKSAPIVWGMQRSIGNRIDGVFDEESAEDGLKTKERGRTRLDGFFRYLPEMAEFQRNGGECERLYRECELTMPK